jgi:glutamyl-tRNA reductase
VRQLQPAARFEVSRTAIKGPAPRIGEHTREVLRELAYSEQDVENMIADKSVRAAAGERGKTSMSKPEKVALLVGAGDAIGAAVAKRLAEGGFTVCIARRDAEKSRQLGE